MSALARMRTAGMSAIPPLLDYKQTSCGHRRKTVVDPTRKSSLKLAAMHRPALVQMPTRMQSSKIDATCYSQAASFQLFSSCRHCRSFPAWPYTLLQLSRSSILDLHLAPHGRAIHVGTKAKCWSVRFCAAIGAIADVTQTSLEDLVDPISVIALLNLM
jgi:hypothetical protein